MDNNTFRCIYCGEIQPPCGQFGMCIQCYGHTLQRNQMRSPHMIVSGIYNVGIMPENTVPSGSCNFSKICINPQ